MTIKSILIANRGEIACRVIRTARAMGYRTIAVFSDADKSALHVHMADTAVAIGGLAPKDSYLSIEKIIQACKTSGADAVHPGYGFLSENHEFARVCTENDLIFIGPSAPAIEAMGNKSRSKDLMINAGVPCIPGYQGGNQECAYLASKAAQIGYPIMIKAAGGGGGRGLRVVFDPEQLTAQINAARIESERAFGSGELLLEKYLTNARHIEIQILADNFGHAIHLGERDCSVQRRHQKIFEESPSPAVTAQIRSAMGSAAVKAAQAINYSGAGTVEFLLSEDGNFYFLEMNTRLQVEHPVTELITGLDLVEWQINVAEGRPLSIAQEDIKFNGHAIEARLYAEDPESDFRPQTGPVLLWKSAAQSSVRVDHGLNECDQVSPYYDSMIAKTIAWGKDRDESTRKLLRALSETRLLGIRSNREFLMHCMEQSEFKQGLATTAFLSKLESLGTESGQESLIPLGAAILLSQNFFSESELSGWCNSGPLTSSMKLLIGGERSLNLQFATVRANQWAFRFADKLFNVQLVSKTDSEADFFVSEPGEGCLTPTAAGSDGVGFARAVAPGGGLLSAADGASANSGQRMTVTFVVAGNEIYLANDQASLKITDVTYRPAVVSRTSGDGHVFSPSNGLIVSIDVQPGQTVCKGEQLCTVEAMKLLQSIIAPATGTVLAVAVKTGEQVKTRQLLVEISLDQEQNSFTSTVQNEGADRCASGIDKIEAQLSEVR